MTLPSGRVTLAENFPSKLEVDMDPGGAETGTTFTRVAAAGEFETEEEEAIEEELGVIIQIK
jgi:hypothetical protein